MHSTPRLHRSCAEFSDILLDMHLCSRSFPLTFCGACDVTCGHCVVQKDVVRASAKTYDVVPACSVRHLTASDGEDEQLRPDDSPVVYRMSVSGALRH